MARSWQAIATLPDTMRDGRDVVVWRGYPAVCSWCDEWCDAVGRPVSGVTHWLDVSEPSRVEISNHALLRYLERVKGLDMARLRAEMETPGLRIADQFGCPVVIGHSGERMIIREGVVVTVIAKRRNAGRTIAR